MTIELAARVNRIKPSATLAVSARASVLKSEGQRILNLSVGEPDFDTPEHIKEAAVQALKDGFTKYTPTVGTAGLRKAIADKLERENHLHYSPKQIIVSCGAKHSLYNVTQMLLDEGDEVIIPAPFWASYTEMVLLTGANPVIVMTEMENRFKLTPEALKKAITNKTRLIILNSPSNPSGVAYTKADLAAIGAVLREHPNIMIATDDIYEKIIWSPEPFANILNACPDLYERTIIINGVSKAYAMTGWRIGYAAAPEPLVKAMEKMQSQCTSGPNSIAQVASQAAIEGSQQCVTDMVHAFKKRHDLALELINDIPGFSCLPADGAFYLYVRVDEAMKKNNLVDDIEFAEHLLTHAGVAVIPGTSFGTPGFMRLSIAVSDETLVEAIEKIRGIL
ncbi:MAG: pyridoxal phosphate-dependent aminotransferase [Candidatus Berkiella sp.]